MIRTRCARWEGQDICELRNHIKYYTFLQSRFWCGRIRYILYNEKTNSILFLWLEFINRINFNAVLGMRHMSRMPAPGAGKRISGRPSRNDYNIMTSLTCSLKDLITQFIHIFACFVAFFARLRSSGETSF